MLTPTVICISAAQWLNIVSSYSVNNFITFFSPSLKVKWWPHVTLPLPWNPRVVLFCPPRPPHSCCCGCLHISQAALTAHTCANTSLYVRLSQTALVLITCFISRLTSPHTAPSSLCLPPSFPGCDQYLFTGTVCWSLKACFTSWKQIV